MLLFWLEVEPFDSKSPSLRCNIMNLVLYLPSLSSYPLPPTLFFMNSVCVCWTQSVKHSVFFINKEGHWKKVLDRKKQIHSLSTVPLYTLVHISYLLNRLDKRKIQGQYTGWIIFYNSMFFPLLYDPVFCPQPSLILRGSGTSKYIYEMFHFFFFKPINGIWY